MGLTTTSNPPISSTTAAPLGLDTTDDGKTEEFFNYDGYREPGDKPNEESNEGWLMFATIVAVIFGSGAVIFLARFFGLISFLRRL